MKFTSVLLTALFFGSLTAHAQMENGQAGQILAPETSIVSETSFGSNPMDELNPFDPNIEQTLQAMDQDYEAQTGQLSILTGDLGEMIAFGRNCFRDSCAIWAQVVRSEQRMYLYINGVHRGTFATSTGMSGYRTPSFDTHPNGRIYDRYTSTKWPGGDYDGLGSTKWPGGDYDGLGNMPYAVFIRGGFAIHGTGRGNWARLGTPASHGCIRIHPDNAYQFNRLVRQYGIYNTWITVQ
jgi:lipoprotein-anchoring transpeptidase ErfK/SrfK